MIQSPLVQEQAKENTRGAVKGDSLTVSAEGTFADSNAAKGKTVTITKPVLGGGSAGDYILADNGQQTSTTADISPKEITVKITPNGGIYEGTITPATAVLDGLVGKDNPEITLTYTGRANDGTEVNGTKVPSLAGTYIVTATITDSNYSLKEDGKAAIVVPTGFITAKSGIAFKIRKHLILVEWML
mgnify:CR=1 FL=1